MPDPTGSNQADWTPRADPDTFRPLSAEEERVIVDKGTEAPFTGEYTDHKEKGYYACRRCGALLYHSSAKFKSGCGWPSFDDELPGAVHRETDADGRRTEILCAHCGGHLGHVFLGEGFTDKNTRHCVNSVSMQFQPESDAKIGRAVFAAGCFWGVEHLMKNTCGVLETSVGYTGGSTEHPTYEEVCSKTTGHAEAVEVVYDPARTDFRTLAKLFFEIHDPTQKNRQGPDVGTQYRSAIFYHDPEQKRIAEQAMARLEQQGRFNRPIATEIAEAGPFYKAESYHQQYLEKRGLATCHTGLQ